MSTEQTSFGIVLFRDISHTNMKCDGCIEGEKCNNNAIIEVSRKNDTNVTYRCSMHARNSWLQQINYE